MGVHANIADRVGIMYAGKIVEEATTAKIFGDPVHPYTQYLINSLPKFGDKAIRTSVPGSPPSLIDLPSGCPFHPRCPHAMDICRQQMPSFTSLTANHRVACWLIGEGRTNMEKLLEVEHLTKVFSLGSMFSRVRITAADNVSFYIKPAEIFTLAGESGCGKTTTARMILGFEEPTSGAIIHNGKVGDHQGQEGLVHRGHPGDLPGSIQHLQPAADGGSLFLRDGPELQACRGPEKTRSN